VWLIITFGAYSTGQDHHRIVQFPISPPAAQPVPAGLLLSVPARRKIV
jgi:hypothetical protein